MSADITISKAVREDVPALSRLAAESFRGAYENHPLIKDESDNPIEAHIAETFTEENIAREIDDPRCHYYVLRCADTSIGYAMLIEDEAPIDVTGVLPIHLERIYFSKENCGKGYGATLLNHCIEQARAMGKKTMWLTVWDGNRKAISFYIRHGFKQSGSIKFELGSTGHEDTDLILEKPI